MESSSKDLKFYRLIIPFFTVIYFAIFLTNDAINYNFGNFPLFLNYALYVSEKLQRDSKKVTFLFKISKIFLASSI